MPQPIDSDTVSEICALHARGLTQRQIATAVGVSISTVNSYVRQGAQATLPHLDKVRVNLEFVNGTVLVGSDAHYWPGSSSTAHRGFVWAANQLGPCCVVLNGDVFDGARISRFDPIGWEGRPKVWEELEVASERLGEIESASAGARLIWTQGNHDARFETKLAKCVPEFEYITGFHLKDHFPSWQPAMAVWINNNTIIKHRFKGGVHAAYNNALHSGLSCVTGHTHRGLVTPFSDYRGMRFGVETGTLAEAYGPQFTQYTEDNPLNWQPGFAVLTYKDGQLLPPELALVVGPGRLAFRGEVFDV